MRIRGRLYVKPATGTAAGTLTRWTAGIILKDSDLAALNVAPDSEADADWLWWHSGMVYIPAAGEVATDWGAQIIEVDTKSMRIAEPQEELVFIIGLQADNAALTWQFSARTLIKCT